MRPQTIIAKARYDMCKSNECGKFRWGVCSVFKGGCACILKAKTRMMGQECPVGIWEPVNRESAMHALAEASKREDKD